MENIPYLEILRFEDASLTYTFNLFFSVCSYFALGGLGLGYLFETFSKSKGA